MEASSMKSPKLLVFGALMLCAFLSGIVREVVATSEVVTAVDISFMFVGVFLLFYWFRLDSDERSYQRSPWLNVGVVALPIVSLPYYFFRTRGFLRGLATSAVFLVAGVAYSLLQLLGIYLSSSPGQG